MENINCFEFCNFCKNHILFNEEESDDFLNKFLYKGFNKKILTLAFRLNPTLIDHVKFDYYKKLNNIFLDIKLPIIYNIGYINIFEIYFYQENLKYNDFEKCCLCNKYYCPLHLYISQFKLFRCNCKKEIYICNDCYHAYSKNIICTILHID